jgi:hypothetical protein
MTWPPALLQVHVAAEGGRRLRLWLPIFPLWPLLLIAILIAPVTFWALAVHQRTRISAKEAVLSGVRMVALFCALRGLRILVDSADAHVLVSLR